MKAVLAAIIAGIVMSTPAFADTVTKKTSAQEPDYRLAKTTCFTWQGGSGSSGSYTSCEPVIVKIIVPEPVVVDHTRVVHVETVKEVPAKRKRE